MATAVGRLTGLRLAAAEPEVDVRRVVTGFVLIGGALCALCLFLPILYVLIIAVPVLAVWIWRAPVRGVYLLTAATALIEVFGLNFSDSLTDRIPLFLNLNNTAGFDFPITPAEILMVTVAVAAFARGAVEGKLHWPTGRLVPAYCIYMLVVLGAEVHGLFAGGDFKTSLWEVRPQAYGFVMFLLTTTLVENRKQLLQLAILFLLAVSVKAVIGDYRYFITLHSVLGPQEEILAHEDSYFLGMFITAGVAGVIWIKNRRFAVLMGIVSVIALIAMLANYRRAGVYALAAAVGVVMLLAFRFEPNLRKRIAWLSVVVAAAGAIFIATSWDKQYGISAQLVRPIRSLVDPNLRDYSSDQYRVAETANLLVTFKTSPLVGVGFGKPFIIVYPMADISSIYPLWNVIPHNTLLWIAMRMGALGFAAFAGLTGFAILQGFGLLSAQRDPVFRALSAFAIAAIVAELVVGYADIQLDSYRNLIFLGVILGIMNRLPTMSETLHV